MKDDLLTLREVAHELRVSPTHVRRIVNSGKLRFIQISERVRRVRREDLDLFKWLRLSEKEREERSQRTLAGP